MTLDEQIDSIRYIVRDGLRKRGYDTTVTVTFHGEGSFFASAPIPIPYEVWRDVLEEGLYGNAWPMTVSVDPA